MALNTETILAGARASHRVTQIEEQRRDLLQRHEGERASHEAAGQDLARELAEFEALRARLDERTRAYGQQQQDLDLRHERERDVSTAQVQDANEDYIRLMEAAVRESGRTADQLVQIFDKQRDVLVAAGLLGDDEVAPEPSRETSRSRPSERGYRRARRTTAETAPTETAPAETAPALSDETEANAAPLAPQPTVNTAPTAETLPAPDGGTAQPESPREALPAAQTPDLPSIAEEGARIDAEVEALSRTPAAVTLTDDTASDGKPLDADWFEDVRRVIPIAAPAGAPTLTTPDAPVAGPPTANPRPSDETMSSPPQAGPPQAGLPETAVPEPDAPVAASSELAPEASEEESPAAETAAPEDGGFALPGAPAVPTAAPTLDGFDELAREFGGRDIDFDVPSELR